MEDVFKEQQIFFDFIINELKNKKISHAYLIETYDYDNIDNLVTELLKFLLCSDKLNDYSHECKICHLIDKKEYPDIKYIRPDGSSIKKEQLLSLMDEFKNKSMYNNKQIYVIEDATKLNQSSANTMLKFLEEPEENIIAILIANNRYKVIDTILSRCQVISLQKNDKCEESEEINELLNIICDNNKNFLDLDKLMEIIPDRLNALDKLKQAEKLLFNRINNKYLNLTSAQIISIISIIETVIERLEFNVNYKLMIDYMLISVLEVTKQ
ncbi:MAG: hypothetical protein IK997_03735 [Bacilli bacterium]|nr:hypothetical protein [Bacilli bacterium]